MPGRPLPSGSGADVDARLHAVEARLAVLEAERRAGGASPAAGGRAAPDVPGPEGFWALEALRRLIGEGSAVLYTGSVSLGGSPRYEWQQGMEVDALLERDWDGFAAPLRALGHPIRLRILRDALEGRRSATELADAGEGGTTGQLYHHLRQLVSAGWLRSSGRGRYEVPPARVVPLLVVLAAAQP